MAAALLPRVVVVDQVDGVLFVRGVGNGFPIPTVDARCAAAGPSGNSSGGLRADTREPFCGGELPTAGPPGAWLVFLLGIPSEVFCGALDTMLGVGHGRLRVGSVMPASPWSPPTGEHAVAELAAVHRWIAANDPGAVGGPYADGDAEHRRTRLTAWVPPATAHDVIASTARSSSAEATRPTG